MKKGVYFLLSKDKLNRISELSKKSKSEGLSKSEKEEQRELREEYLQEFRGAFKNHLKSIKVVDPEGTDVTPEKLKEEKRRKEH